MLRSQIALTLSISLMTIVSPATSNPTTGVERFESYLTAQYTKEMHADGYSGKPDYRIVLTDDLNGDGTPDYIVFNQTAGYCGSGGCSYEIYLTGKKGYSEVEADLFGKSSVFVRQSHEAWKEVYTSDGGTLLAYPVYHRNVYDVAKKRYVEVESWFCGGLDFDACSAPLLFCTIEESQLDVREGATVFRAPFDEPITLAGVGSQYANVPIPAPGESDYVDGQTTDGKWFMVIYRQSGALYVRRSDILGSLPLPKAPCELN